MNLSLIFETFTNGFTYIILDFFSITSVIMAILTIINKNPIVSVLFLISLFSIVSIYLISIGMPFIGISYLLVYVGAVSILFLFILMLVNIRISELSSSTGNSMPLAIFIVISFYFIFNNVITYNSSEFFYPSKGLSDISNQFLNSYYKVLSENENIYYATSKNWEGSLAEATDITSLGNIMYTNYSIWLILSSFILLLSMVGAIVITIK